MRRADRLFQIVQLLRHRRTTTAAQLAQRLEVSERTIYRDIADLGRSGVPIEGEAGVGYRMGKNFELPPLMFNVAEIQALVLGARMVDSWADDELRGAVRSALDKIEAVLPEAERERLRTTALFSVSFHVPEDMRRFMGTLRHATDQRRIVQLSYEDKSGSQSERRVRPLGLYFWGRTWTLAAWCELRGAFRNFRLDRISAAETTDDTFQHESPSTIDDYVRAMTADLRDGQDN
ncbi:MAG: YafY family transcriptional regulator [Nannocystaceae bacterium]|nr:YafY family transcriptional regulator [Nannocystaceae bacterium]